MSTKIKNVVYRASWRDGISANFESVTFSTATGDYTNYPSRLAGAVPIFPVIMYASVTEDEPDQVGEPGL